MPKTPSDARNVEYLRKQANTLKKQHHARDRHAAESLRASNPNLAALTPGQISEIELRQRDYQAAVARQFGFPTWEKMIVYAEGRPRRESGGIVIAETPGLTLEQAINERANLHDMPPLGTVTANQYGIEWVIADYGFFQTSSLFARYPGDCDYLPIVFPRNISQRLTNFIRETDRCTSKQIVFLDTMPGAHPFGLGQDIHCANFGGDPSQSYIFLDAARAHETTIAHELAHLWLIYVEGGDDCRTLRDKSDNGKVNQLDFLRSFVLDLKVNDLIAERGFDMSLINDDEINSLTMLRDAFALGHRPPTAREALLNSLTMAAAILEQKRWPDEMKQRLSSLLDIFADAAPQVHQIAQELVEIVRRHGYDSRESIRKVLDECIALGFRAPGDELDLERDLQEATLTECMQDKHPEFLPGQPVLLKLEIGKTLARNGISGGACKVWLSATITGMAQVTVEVAAGMAVGPLPVNYQLVPLHLLHEYAPLQLGKHWLDDAHTADEIHARVQERFGPPQSRFPWDNRPLVNGMVPDDFGRLPGEPGYNTCFPPGYVPGEPWPDGQPDPAMPTHDAFHHGPTHQNPFAPAFDPFHPNPPRQHNPPHWPPNTGMMRRYMAGVGLSVARARLAQMREGAERGPDPNLYKYAYNNPTVWTDPSGLSCIMAIDRHGPVYLHAYIKFNMTRCRGADSAGFWPNSIVRAILNPCVPGVIDMPDPRDGAGACEGGTIDNRICFEEALCKCILDSSLDPPDYCFDIIGGYDCGSWAAEMYACASSGCSCK